jgi:acetyl esterase/lipase
MPLDPPVKRLLDRLAVARSPGDRGQSLAERRSNLAELMRLAGAPEPVAQVEDGAIPGARGPLGTRIYTPRALGAEPSAGLVYLHGGGLVAGSLDTHDPIARALAQRGACRVVAVDYRLAPEHRFPAAIEDATAAVRHVSSHAGEFAIDPRRLGVAGDSAGAALAAVVCQTMAAAGAPRLALQLLLCPIMDYAASSASRREFADGYLLDSGTLEQDLRWYLPAGVAPDDPRVSPLRARDVSGVAPAAIHTAEFDPVRDDGLSYAQSLQRAGVPTTYQCHSGMIHLFYALGRLIPYAQLALTRIGVDIQTALS